MKKIMHFIHSLNTGGAETLVKNYMLYLDNKKFDVVLLCLDHCKESPYEGALKDNGVRVIYVEDFLFFKGHSKNVFKKAINRYHKYLVVRRIIRKESPDILHAHLPLDTYEKFARPKKETIIFHTIHSEPKKLYSGDNRHDAREMRAAKWLVKHYDVRFIALHNSMRDEIKKIFNTDSIIVLNNGVEVDKFTYKEDIKKQNDLIPQGSFVVGHIGRFSETKNQDFLVDVFMEIRRKKQNSFLLMIGDGRCKNDIIKKIEGSSNEGKYLILSNRDDMPDLINAMDVFVFPSLYEGLPLSLVEAQVAKKPCFISDTINEHAIISNLVTKLSLNDSAEKWADVILNYKIPAKIEVNGKDWDIKEITKQLEIIYTDALSEKQNGKK